MAMIPGLATITIDDTGAPTYGGTGLAAALAPALMAPAIDAFGTPLTSAMIVAIKAEASFYVSQANALAAAIVTYIQGNAVVPHGTISGSGSSTVT